MYLFVKLKTLTATLLLLQAIPKSNSYTILPKLYYTINQPSTPVYEKENDMSWTFDQAHDYVSSLLLLGLVLIILLIYLKNHYTHRGGQTILQMELTNGSLCAILPIQTLPLCPKHWNFQASEYVQDVTISGIFRPIVTVEWHDLKITDVLTEQSFRPPKTLHVNLLTALVLRRILKTQHSIYLFLNHNGYAFQFGISELTEDTEE